MDYPFVPAAHILGRARADFSTEIKDHPKLPNGTYRLVELYCTDPNCDCRKTIFNVYHNDTFVGPIDFGWETLNSYTRWANGNKDLAREMTGWSVNPLSSHQLDPR